MNQAIHNVDLLQWLMGDVDSIMAQTALLVHERIEVEDTAVAVLRFKNGALGVIEAATSAFPGCSSASRSTATTARRGSSRTTSPSGASPAEAPRTPPILEAMKAAEPLQRRRQRPPRHHATRAIATSSPTSSRRSTPAASRSSTAARAARRSRSSAPSITRPGPARPSTLPYDDPGSLKSTRLAIRCAVEHGPGQGSDP